MHGKPIKRRVPLWLRVAFWAGTTLFGAFITLVALLLAIGIAHGQLWDLPMWVRALTVFAVAVTWTFAAQSLAVDLWNELRTARK